jgi:hypothetical protein
MTAEEKCNDLINKFFPTLEESMDLEIIGKRNKHAIQCAIIVADEIIDNAESRQKTAISVDYWKEVKSHLLKM